MGFVVTVTANAALDRTIDVDAMRVGARHRVRFDHAQAGGKGVNVSRVLAVLGSGVRSVVAIGGATGNAILRDLHASALGPVPVAAAGESRTCLEILDTGAASATQFHGVGVRGSVALADALVATVVRSIEGASWLALCGSLPDGCPEDTYARLIHCARRRGVRVALDTSGRALVAGWRGAPDILRINRDEAAEAFGDSDPQSIVAAAGDSARERLVVVSDGARTIRAWRAGRAWRVQPPAVRTRNAIGCGDAMLAGLLALLDLGATEEALRAATAVAAASAESGLAGRVDPTRAASLSQQVEVVPL